MFGNLTDEELSVLFGKIKSGRRRAWLQAQYGITWDASGIMTDINDERDRR